MTDLQEFEKTRKLRAASFMMKQHRQACEEQGDDPEEVDTFYSLAADALSRALPAVQPGHVNETPKSEHDAVNMLTLTAERDRLREALLDHNDLLRSAIAIAEREGVRGEIASTNWDAYYNRAAVVLKRHHQITTDARAALKGESHD